MDFVIVGILVLFFCNRRHTPPQCTPHLNTHTPHCMSQGQDLASGNLTAPVLFALQSAEHKDALLELIEGEFEEDGDLEKALQLVYAAGGIEKARQLARQEADKALQALDCLPDSPSKRSLQLMVSYVLERLY